MAKYRYKYAVDEPDYFYTLESNWVLEELEYIAEDCAEDYHSNHDGWEARWPLTFTIATEDETILGTFEVEREARPQFYASKKG